MIDWAWISKTVAGHAMTAHDCHRSCDNLKLVLKTVTGQGTEFGERTRPNLGSAGSEFGERIGPNPGPAGSEKGSGRTLVRQVQSSKKGRFLSPNSCRFGERTGPNPGSAGSEFGERQVPFSEL